MDGGPRTPGRSGRCRGRRGAGPAPRRRACAQGPPRRRRRAARRMRRPRAGRSASRLRIIPHSSEHPSPLRRARGKVYNSAMTPAQVMADSSGVPVVKAEAIKKSFGQHVVLDGIDLDVARERRSSSSGRAGAGRARSCAASTCSSRSTAGGSSSRARRSRARAPRWPRSGSASGSSSSSSTCSRT